MGRLGEVFRGIDSLPPSLDREKPFIRIQMLHRAGMHAEALKGLTELQVHADQANPLALVRLARIAVDAGAPRTAEDFLAPAIEQLETAEDLHQALAIAIDAGSQTLEEAAVARLEEVFPDSIFLLRRRIRDFIAEGRYDAAAVAAQSAGRARLGEMYQVLHETLRTNNVPDYSTLAARFAESEQWLSDALPALVHDAMSRRLPFMAFSVLPPERGNGQPSPREIILLLDVIEAVIIERGNEEERADVRLTAAVRTVVEYLAARPTDAITRLRLTRLLSPDVSGMLGLTLIVAVVLGLLQRLNISTEPNQARGRFFGRDILERGSFVRAAFRWLADEAPVVIGKVVLPKDLITDDPDDLLAGITDTIGMLCQSINDDTDVDALLLWMLLGSSLTPHSSDPGQDLRLIRLVGGALANAGRAQQARDLSETALAAAGPSSKRQPIAWSTVADIYHRVGNHLESLVALSCAAATPSPIGIEDAWSLNDSLMRLLRDLGFDKLARSVHQHAGSLIRQMGRWEANRHRYEFAETQLELLSVLREPDRIPKELPTVIDRLTENARTVLDEADDPSVVATMLAQAIRIADDEGVPLPATISETLHQLLGRMSSLTASSLCALSASRPTVDDLLLVHQRTAGARYAEDVGFDARISVLVARRILAAPDIVNHPESVALAVEILADRAIATPGWQTEGKPSPPLADAHEPSRNLKSIAINGLSVLMAALDRAGSLVTMSASNGSLDTPQRVADDVFASERLEIWRQQFPYRYGIDANTPNLFHVSTEALRFPAAPAGRLLLILDTELQQLPPNLLRVGDDFIGSTRPVAAAPSLSWLLAARKRGLQTTGRRVAWISTDDRRGQALAMIADRVSPTLAEHGIVLDNGSELPSGYADADLVVVAAHGAITLEGRFFQRVSDEGSLSASATEFARTLRNIGVVILFICSGGRVDAHPMSNTTIGLVRQVLHQGCSAVIASPWPLDVSVPPHWLSIFLEAWKSGMPIIDATFEANRGVGKAFGGDLARSLAMTLFGDPLRAYPAGTQSAFMAPAREGFL